MYTDAQLRFSSEQDLATPAAGNIASTNTLDLLAAVNNLGIGYPVRLHVNVEEAFAGGTSLNVQIIQSDASDMSSPDVLAQTGAVALASLPGLGGVLWDTPMPNNTKRYVALRYVTVGDFTTGKASAHIVEASDRNPYLPANTGL